MRLRCGAGVVYTLHMSSTRRNFLIPDRDFRALRKIARRQGESVSYLVREAIRWVIEAERKKQEKVAESP